MVSRMRFVLGFGLLLATTLKAAPPTDGGPNPDVPELAELKMYVGKFQVEVVEPSDIRGQAEGEWIHNGRFVKQSFYVKNNQGSEVLNGTHIFTYDDKKKQYRCWRFYSNGISHEATGTWDAAHKTMTWVGPDPDSSGTLRMVSTFDKEGGQTWSVSKEDPNGRTDGQIKGKHTPIK